MTATRAGGKLAMILILGAILAGGLFAVQTYQPLDPFADILDVAVTTEVDESTGRWTLLLELDVDKHRRCDLIHETGRIRLGNAPNSFPSVAAVERTQPERVRQTGRATFVDSFPLPGPLRHGTEYVLSFRAECLSCTKTPEGVPACRFAAGPVDLPLIPFTAWCEPCGDRDPSE